MPDNLIVPPPPSLHTTVRRSARPDLSRPVRVQVTIIVAAFVVGGLAAGLAAATLWTPPTGMVLEDKWYRGLISIDPPAIGQNIDQGVFAATAWFSVCAIVLGLLVGIAAAVWLNRSELVTLAAVTIGGAIGGALMLLVTSLLSPEDPNSLAKGAADGTVLEDSFQLASPWLVLLVPGSAMLALMVIFLMWAPHQEADPADQPDS
ncbi:hypothetical protein [Nocardioides panzhihuensis]|uniref:Uncharacterized membrane protein YqaE (UPF0057 family) n=1 Tax=Nocardioides panzhihuensis TaxID=860243 RepID=A0A7Z0DJI6_9ACTN|nr:hypothetical protein [Nocardioides panzhihuensis]NYI76545.1 uncharacterized membrane protein YqaE (UPF0057 family) [Nocardioides panzhihuensis]